jgi:streptogramin lyase
VAATVALFVATSLVRGVLTSGGPGTAPPATTQVVLRPQAAAAVAFAHGSGWVADDRAGTLRRFDLASGTFVGRPVSLGGRPISLAAGFGRLWIADLARNEVWQVDPTTGKVVGTATAVPSGPVSMAAGDGGVWVASLLAGTVTELDPRSGQVKATAVLPDGAVRLAVGPGAVWVTGQTDTLTRIEPSADGTALRWHTVRVGQGPIGVAAGSGSVWVANVQSVSVSRVDPAQVRVTATFALGTGSGGSGDPEIVALWQGRVWVADGQQGVMIALDPATGRQIGGSVAVPGVIRQLAVDPNGTLWGTTANPGTVVRFFT